MSDYIEMLDETDPGSNLVGDTLIHTDMTNLLRQETERHTELSFSELMCIGIGKLSPH